MCDLGRSSRRRFVAATVTGGAVSLAGCRGFDGVSDERSRTDERGSSFTDAELFRFVAQAVEIVSTPWSKTAIDRANEIHETIVGRLDTLLRGWTSQRSSFIQTALATYDSLKTLTVGQQAFQMELVRAEIKRTMAAGNDDEIESRLDEAGVTYDSDRPFHPLFRAIKEGAEIVSHDPSDESKQLLANRANHVSYLLTMYYRPAFERAEVSGSFVIVLEATLNFLDDLCEHLT